MYVVFEGIDTCGKSTQIELLKPIFPDAIFTKEPGGSKIGAKIREIILMTKNLDFYTEFFLFLADRAQHYKEVLLPNKDKKIFADRSFISGIAYAKDKMKESWEYNLFVMRDMLPDKVILFYIDRESLEERILQKDHDVIEQRGIDYLMKIQDNLLEVVEKLDCKKLLIDATKPRDFIHQQVLKFII